MLRADRQTKLSFLLLAIVLSFSSAKGQTTSFTYQGRLSDSGTAANGNYDLQFALFDSLAGGAQVGSTQTLSNVPVSAGIFTVSLDFGASAFPGASRWLEIRARLNGTPTFTTLAPRQSISATPYAVRALTAATADNVNAVGTLTGNVVDAVTQFNLNGTRIMTNAGTNNLFAGVNAGQSNTSLGVSNAFFGFGAGRSNAEGSFNSFFGTDAGSANVNGLSNSFFGYRAGFATTNNSQPFTGGFNAFFGAFTGEKNTTGSFNSFYGYGVGESTTVGSGNSFFGRGSGVHNDSGSNNVFLGINAGQNNTGGSGNIALGADSSFIGTLTNATAIGTKAQVTQSDSLVLGSIAGVNGATTSVSVGIGTTTPLATLDTRGNMLVSGNVGIGTTTPLASLHVKGATVIETSGSGGNISLAAPNGESGLIIAKEATGRADLRFDGTTLKLVAAPNTGPPAATNGVAITTAGNVGIGTAAPTAPLHVNGGALVTTGNNREVSIGSPNGESGIGIRGTSNRADVRFDSTALRLVAGPGTGPPAATSGISITTSGNVGVGQTSPLATLDVAGTLKVDSLAGGGNESLCRNSTFHTLATCSSSLRYKKEIAPYRAGLDLINRFHPISFSWKTSGSRDLGFGAEDVAKVEPLLVTQNDNGEIEGVRYDRINVVLVNAIKQQQEQIQDLQARLLKAERALSERKSVTRRRRRK